MENFEFTLTIVNQRLSKDLLTRNLELCGEQLASPGQHYSI